MKRRAIAPPTLIMIKVNEFFTSIQGESTWAGVPCFFVRLTGCNLSCNYCDTQYALKEGTDYAVDDIVKKVAAEKAPLVEITGGEPLLQRETPLLASALIKAGHTVLVETNGTLDISMLPAGAIRIMDIKCPDSGNDIPFLETNLTHLCRNDECKMVISSKEDFTWALDFVHEHGLHRKCTVIFSPNTACVPPRDLAGWILDAHAPVRLGLQLHKILWGDAARGV